MSDKRIAPISGVAHATPRLRRMARAIHGPRMAASIETMLADAAAVNALAGAIDRALIAGTSKDGRIDLKETAIALIGEMRRNQR